MVKRVGDVADNFIEHLRKKQAEMEAQEKAVWESLSEPERQGIITEREREKKEIEAEEQKKQREKQEKKWQMQGIKERYFEAEWDNWIADTPEKEIALKAAKTAWNTNLFFTGKNGTGKTHLAMCLVKEGAVCKKISKIYREIRLDLDAEQEIIDSYAKCKLLIIDETGRQKFSDFEMNLLFEIIDERWNNVLPTTIITNFTVDEFSEIYGMAILDRLRPVKVRFNWESMRGVNNV